MPRGRGRFRIEAYARFLSKYPFTDRVTFHYDAPAAICYGLLAGLAVNFASFVGRKIGLDNLMLTILGISGFVGLFLNLWIGHIAEKGNRRNWVFWPGLIARALIGISLLFFSPVYFLVIMCAFNVFANLGGPAYSSIMRSNYSDRYRGELMGYIRILIQAAMALGALVGGWAMELIPDGARWVFMVASLFGIASTVMFGRLKPRKIFPPRPSVGAEGTVPGGAPIMPAHKESFREAFAEMMKDKVFIVFMAIYFIITFADKLIVPLEPIRFVDELHMTYGENGIIIQAITILAGIVGYFVLAKSSHKLNPLIFVMGASIALALRMLNVAIATEPYQLIPGSFLNGIGGAFWDLMPLLIIAIFAGSQRMSLYFGFHGTLIGLRGMIGPVIGNWLYADMRMRITDIYMICFSIEVFGFILLFAFYRYLKKHRPMQFK